MNKKGANEIKKLFTPAGCTITCICGCHMDSEKNRKTELEEAFFSLQGEEAFKYFIIFRNTLSGTVGKNLINMGFPLHMEAEGGTQHFLLKLRDNQLKDDAVLEELYGKVIAAYDYGEGYYVILIYYTYDVPVKATNGTEMFGASGYVYELIQCIVCPVKFSKAGLCYNSLTNIVENRDRDRLVKAPVQGLLFPTFNDRNTDVHSLLYYVKNPEELSDALIDELLDCMIPMSAKSQEGIFQAIVEEALGENCDFETVKGIHENLSELVEETKDEPVPLTLDKCRIRKLLEINGASPGELEEFEQRCAEVEEGPNTSFVAANVIDTRSFEIKTPNVSIKVSLDKIHLVENRMIDGRSCIVIAADEHTEINGIAVCPVAAPRMDDNEDENAQVPFWSVSGHIWTETGKTVKKQ